MIASPAAADDAVRGDHDGLENADQRAECAFDYVREDHR